MDQSQPWFLRLARFLSSVQTRRLPDTQLANKTQRREQTTIGKVSLASWYLSGPFFPALERTLDRVIIYKNVRRAVGKSVVKKPPETANSPSRSSIAVRTHGRERTAENLLAFLTVEVNSTRGTRSTKNERLWWIIKRKKRKRKEGIRVRVSRHRGIDPGCSMHLQRLETACLVKIERASRFWISLNVTDPHQRHLVENAKTIYSDQYICGCKEKRCMLHVFLASKIS